MVNKTKILIVDDDVNICEILKDILEEKGYEVTTVNDGGSAIDCARNSAQDVILLDMRLPDMNGLETYRVIRKFDSAVLVAFMTVYKYEWKRCEEEAMKEGAFACIYKPFNVEEVFDILEESRHRKKK